MPFGPSVLACFVIASTTSSFPERGGHIRTPYSTRREFCLARFGMIPYGRNILSSDKR